MEVNLFEYVQSCLPAQSSVPSRKPLIQFNGFIASVLAKVPQNLQLRGFFPENHVVEFFGASREFDLQGTYNL